MARETSIGEFHGSTSSVGFSSNGISVSGGSLHGSTTSSSYLAKQVDRPDLSVYEPGNPYGTRSAMACISGLAILGIGPVMDELVGPTVGTQLALIQGIASFWPMVAAGLMFIVSGSNFLKMATYEPDPESAEKFEQLRALATKMSDTYDRLMYCQADHIVFDPVTGSYCPPQQNDIKNMLNDISTKS